MLNESAFDNLYGEVAEVETTNLEDLFTVWNAGSGLERAYFYDLRYCERCQSYIKGLEEAVTHAAQNHGYDAFHESRDPEYLRGIRSMSVGDIVTEGDTHFACAPIGWEELRLVEGDS